MLAHGQQLEVGEAHVLRVGDERVGELVPAQEAVAVDMAPPRAEVHFVDAHRRIERVGALALRRRGGDGRQRADDARGGRAQLGLQRERVGLERQQLAVARADLVLVGRADGHARHEDLPDAALATQPHPVAACVPVIEVADDAHLRRVRRPHREGGARDALQLAHDRPQHLVGTQVRALAQQPGVGLAEDGRESIGILQHRGAAVAPVRAQAVGIGGQIQRAFEEAVGVARRQLALRRGVRARQHRDSRGTGQDDAQPAAAVGVGMRAEHGERVAVVRGADAVDLGVGEHVVQRS